MLARTRQILGETQQHTNQKKHPLLGSTNQNSMAAGVGLAQNDTPALNNMSSEHQSIPRIVKGFIMQSAAPINRQQAPLIQ